MKMTLAALTFAAFFLLCGAVWERSGKEHSPTPSDARGGSAPLVVKHSEDFEVTGNGQAEHWDAADWVAIPQRGSAETSKDTRLKALYSDTGIYFLFRCEDETLTATMQEDFMDLWKEDVVEVFLWPEEDFPVYFEYELSPLNYELPILVPNNDGEYLGWRPWNYEGDRRTRHATSVQGGKKESGAEITSWTAEFYIPFALLKPLGQVPPSPGTTWRANFYRVDHDGAGAPATWEWQPTDTTFHRIEQFGTVRFD
jgi:hypothetical protein